jgi:glucokinase
MRLLGIDLGGTKIAAATFSKEGAIIERSTVLLNGSGGKEVGELIQKEISKRIKIALRTDNSIGSIAISVPGISNTKEGTVWAPNIPGWEKYPLLEEIKSIAVNIPVVIESDRTCYILGEVWKGSAKGCEDAIYMSVGTGIGAGIIINGHVFRGANDISGAIGWMALKDPYNKKFESCGHFEYYASGEGIARLAKELSLENVKYKGVLSEDRSAITAYDVFEAYERGDEVAEAVFAQCITYWGMAVANLVSLFNPQKVILGGGVFGPAKQFIPEIYKEAKKWGQPISMELFKLEGSVLGNDAGLYGAGYAALKNIGD